MKKKESVVFKLSLRFSAILTFAVIAIIFVLFMMLRYTGKQQEYRGFERNSDMILHALRSGNIEFLDRRLAETPFFVSYIIYDDVTGEIFRQKNDRMGILPNTGGKPVHRSSARLGTNEQINILYMTTQCPMPDGRIFILQVAQNTNNDAGNRFIQKILLWIAEATIPILIISFFLSLFITGRTIQPVVKITDAAAKISSTNLDQRLPETGNKDELDNLARTFNSLFSRLKTDFDRERSFTSNVSHELKTPVAVILGQTNLLRRWGKNEPQQLEKSLSIILQETRSMESIITNLLQLSRLESGKIAPKKESVDMMKMFARLKDEFESMKSGCKIVFDKNQIAPIETDRELLHQVFIAAISNSCKFAGENPEVTLSCSQDNGIASIKIQDNGSGFQENVIPHVFERFYRGDESHNRSAGGSGLGLSIAKAIMESLNGTIEAQNAKDGGALITICLPCKPGEEA